MLKTAIITGAGRGIGAATACQLADLGYELHLIARSLDQLNSTKQKICKDLPLAKIHLHPLDVSDESKVMEFFSELKSLDLLINNAGYIRVNSIENFPSTEFYNIINTNLFGCFLFSREAFNLMKASGGLIINISSLGGIQGSQKFPGFSVYSAAKAAVIAFTECLAIEGRKYGIRANAIAPGAVRTQMLEEALPGFETSTLPEDIAKEIVNLLENEQLNGTIRELTNA